MLIVALLAVSVSLDTLGVAMAYGMSGIVIPLRTRIWISFINGALTALAIWLGQMLCSNIPAFVFQIVGAVILIGLGIKTLWNALGDNTIADYDKNASRVIELREGCLIGVILAMDSVSAALGIMNLGNVVYSLPICVAVLCYVFLLLGGKCTYNLRRLNGISAVILIVLGLFRLLPDFF